MIDKMKITVSSASLLKHLSSIGGIITSNPIVPILDNFLFEIDGGVLKIMASDLQTYFITNLKVEVSDANASLRIAVPARILLDTLKNLPDQQVVINININSYSMEIKSSNGRYKLACENSEDYPECPPYIADTAMEVKGTLLKRAINKLLFAISSDDTKPFLTGIFVEIKSCQNNTHEVPGGLELEGNATGIAASDEIITDSLVNKTESTNKDEKIVDTATAEIFSEENVNLIPSSFSEQGLENKEFQEREMIFVASDGHKLAKYVLKDVSISSSFPVSCIIPKKPLNIVNGFSVLQDEVLDFSLNKSHAYLKLGNIEMITRLIHENYPNYNNVLPSESPYKLTISRDSILSSLKRVSIYANKSAHFVKIKLSASELNIFTEDHNFSNEAIEKLPCHYEGEELEIGFNSKFLIEALNRIDTEEVVFYMGEPHRAVLLFPASQLEHEELLLLVMPVALENEEGEKNVNYSPASSTSS